jgi:hypothetical protein
VTTYYVDATDGLDGNTGLSELVPWQTMSKLAGITPAADDIILLKRGEVWRELWSVTTGGTSGHPVVYGAYGSEAKPKVTGCDLLTGWTMHTVSGALFADGFESGDISAWSTATNPGGQLTVGGAGALVGSYGLSVAIASQVHAFVQDNTPNGETTYRCRFYLDPNTLAMANADEFILFRALTGAAASVFFVKLQYFTATGYHLYVYERDDSWVAQTYQVTITDAPHYVEMKWVRATGAGTNDGTFALWVDGSAPAAEKTGIDNDTLEISTVRLGAELELDTGTSGTLYMDAFYSNNSGDPIGATDPTGDTNIYKATYADSIDTYLLLEDGAALTRVGSLAAVSSAGKYFPDNANNLIYAWCTDGEDADTHTMEIGARYDAVACDDRSYVTLQDLHFHGAGGQYGRTFGCKPTSAGTVPAGIALNSCEVSHGGNEGVQFTHLDGAAALSVLTLSDCEIHHNLGIGVWFNSESLAAGMTGILVTGGSIHDNGLATSATYGIWLDKCAGPTVTHCLIYNNVGSLDWSDNLLSGSSDSVVTYNQISGGNHSGIHFDVHADGAIHWNIIDSCNWNAIWIEEHQTGAGDATTIYHNTCYHNRHGLVFGPGSTIHEVSGVTVKNNIFAFNRRANVELNDDVGYDFITGNTLDYNCYQTDPTPDPLYLGEFLKDQPRVAHTFTQWKTETGWDANSLNESPQMVDPSNGSFRLQATSPCIDVGANVSLTPDYGGTPVPQGDAPEMGAYEYVEGISQAGLRPLGRIRILTSPFGR